MTPNSRPKRILVLDDDAVTGEEAAMILNRLGYESESETDASESMRRVLDNEFDLLLTDFRKLGLNGFQVAQTLRTMGSTIPIILHTEENGTFDPDDLRLLGIIGVIRKPLRPDAFHLALKRILYWDQD